MSDASPEAPVSRPDPAPDPPLPSDLAGRLRLEVGRFRVVERRRVFPPVLHAGVPAGPRVRLEVPTPPGGLDDGLRSELAVRLLEQARASERSAGSSLRATHVWVTRPGDPRLHDEDQLWHAATRWACADLERGMLGFLVLTKGGWLDVTTGEHRAWKRLRL